ncbi:MAG: Spy/CpxP family protein refolding chaperone [Rhizobiales bacterium]|nr:Spy/CpxP family protein refolding chaperone [Rhizobacter sp.]
MRSAGSRSSSWPRCCAPDPPVGAPRQRFTELYDAANPASRPPHTIPLTGNSPDCTAEISMRDVKAARLSWEGYRSGMWLLAASVLVAAASVSFAANAQGYRGEARGGSGGSPEMTMFGGSPERVGRSVDRMLDGLNATDAQRSQIKQIAAAAAADLKIQREAGSGLREQAVRIFTAPTVDGAAAESLRQQMSAQHEQSSKRMLQAMLDVAGVLTPEQRAQAGERIAQRRAAVKERMQDRPPRGARAASQPAPQR